MPWILLAARVALGALFLFSAWTKFNPTQPALFGIPVFAQSVKAFDILPDHLVVLTAFVIPWAELLAGVALLVGFWTRAAALVVSALLAVFIAAIVSVITRDMNIECGCFGKFTWPCEGPAGWCKVWMNTGLLAVAALVAAAGGGAGSVDSVVAERGAGRRATDRF